MMRPKKYCSRVRKVGEAQERPDVTAAVNYGIFLLEHERNAESMECFAPGHQGVTSRCRGPLPTRPLPVRA